MASHQIHPATGIETPTGSFSEEAVLAQLERVLSAPDLVSSKRLTGFLRFVVEETLADRSHTIKQFTIATKVFERDPDFDQHNDPIVRVQAAKLRRILNRYYWEEGSQDPIRIEIPKGTYVPEFSPVENRSSDPNSTVKSSNKPTQKKITIAVMPFANNSGDDSLDYMASGFTEDLATELSRFSEIAVIGYQTTLEFRNSQLQVAEYARGLNADFVVTGSIRQVEPELRLNVQVSDVHDGVQIWAERFHRQRSGTELFAIQDEILQQISARACGTYGAIRTIKADSSRRKDQANLTAYEAVLKSLYYDKTMEGKDYEDAYTALTSAVEQFPDYANARARLGILQLDGFGFGFDPGGRGLIDGTANAERAVALDPKSQDAQMAISWASLLGKDIERAAKSARRIVELNPGDASMVAIGGWFLGLTGDRKRAMEIIEHSKILNPNCPSWLQLIPFLEAFENQQFESALELAHQIAMPEFFWDPMLKAATLAKLNRIDMAKPMLQKTTELRPDFADKALFYVSCLVVSDQLRNDLMEGLNRAGLHRLSGQT